eukprot:CAMPEP_0198290886 /NCGR_PEP_ID=MMETSP1449-20131203/8588_1 /TAXON_ID=420275 /ORGANISM="Attheya septentrionalis, Strain CCMP2084" /LENGTH=272 /DNA_ID=CAMNT_0043989445 /DNA_START=65 /DNA_END=883 /DNA_ORIENTATION=+
MNNPSSSTAGTPIVSTRPMCRFFVTNGTCWNGSECHFSHELPDGVDPEVAQKQIVCPFFQQGNCHFGESCRYSHSVGDVDDTERSSDTRTCGICLDDVPDSGKQFGLLLNCNHCFCYDCLTKWRQTKASTPSTVNKCCPVCREKSDFIVRSSYYCVEEEKEGLVNSFKARMSVRPCQQFNGSIGSCSFGPDCLYAHLGEEGEDMKPNDIKKKRRPRRRRSQTDAEFIMAMLMLLSMDIDSDDIDSDDDSQLDEEELHSYQMMSDEALRFAWD